MVHPETRGSDRNGVVGASNDPHLVQEILLSTQIPSSANRQSADICAREEEYRLKCKEIISSMVISAGEEWMDEDFQRNSFLRYV